jgi:hypothetical protein
MSIFKSTRRKIFKKNEDVLALINAANDVSRVVEGTKVDRWVINETGQRLSDVDEWKAFREAVLKLIAAAAMLVLAGCSAPAPVQKSAAMIPPMASGEVVTNKLIRFGWTHPHPETVEHYKLYYGPSPRNYTNFVTATATNTTFTADLTSVHYFTVTANAGAQESDWSNEVGYPPWLVPRTNVVLVSQWSTNMVDWQEVRRETNAINGNLGFWRLKIE